MTAPRLELLLTSLTTLSSLHTSSSAPKRSIWHHDPSATIDPLAAVAAAVTDDGDAGAADDWASVPVGGEGDVEVGEEGVRMDAELSKSKEKAVREKPKKEKKEKSSSKKSKRKSVGEAMEVDE